MLSDFNAQAARIVLSLQPLIGVDGNEPAFIETLAEYQQLTGLIVRFDFVKRLLFAGVQEQDVARFMSDKEHPDRMIALWWMGLSYTVYDSDHYESAESAKSLLEQLNKPWRDLVEDKIQSQWFFSLWEGSVNQYRQQERRMYRAALSAKIDELKGMV